MFDHDKYIAQRAATNRFFVREAGRDFLKRLAARDSKGRIEVEYANGELIDGSNVSLNTTPTSRRLYNVLANTRFTGPPVDLSEVIKLLESEDAPALGFKRKRMSDGHATWVELRSPRKHRASRD